MQLTTLTPIANVGVEVDVEVDEDGKFSAVFGGETHTDDTLAGLGRYLRDAILAARHEVPFVSTTGRRGVLRGYHAGTRELLVTWSDGQKGRISHYVDVFRPEDISDSEIAEILRLMDEIDRAQTRLAEIRKKADDASKLFSEAFGEDITDYRRNRQVATA